MDYPRGHPLSRLQTLALSQKIKHPYTQLTFTVDSFNYYLLYVIRKVGLKPLRSLTASRATDIEDILVTIMGWLEKSDYDNLLCAYFKFLSPRVSPAILAKEPNDLTPDDLFVAQPKHLDTSRPSHQILFDIGLTANINSAMKQEVIPLLNSLFIATNNSKACSNFIQNSIVHASPVLSAALVRVASHHSLSSSLLIATVYVSKTGLPGDLESGLEFAPQILMPLAPQVVTKFAGYFGVAIHPHIKTAAITVSLIGTLLASNDKANNSHNSFSEVVTNIIEDNSDPISLFSLTFIGISGFGLVTSPASAFVMASSLSLLLSSGHAAYKREIVPNSLESLSEIAHTVVDPYIEDIDNMVQCIGEAF